MIRKHAIFGYLRFPITVSSVQQWNPECYITPQQSLLNHKIAVIVLNRPILVQRELFVSLWNSASVRVTVDGGTNHWYQFVNGDDGIKSPNIVCGDFDSITEATLFHIKKLGCKIIHTPDQDATDFTKALRIISPQIEEEDISSIVVVAETSGRIDQIMANLNTLFLTSKIFTNFIRIYILSSNSLSWLLNSGQHTIKIPRLLLENKRWCALIPIGQMTRITTSGLKWNLDHQILQFGALVSSSNTYDTSEFVKVETEDTVLWSMGISTLDD